jgi:hypothetical protein
VRRSVDAALRAGRQEEALDGLAQAEKLLELTRQKWGPIREQLVLDDQLRRVAAQLAIEVPPVEGVTGSPRSLLFGAPLSDALLLRVRTTASASVRTVSNEILRYGISESRKLGTRIRAASQRGEDVRETTEAFRRLVRTIGARAAVDVGDRLAELRRAAARIPSAPAYPVPITDEEGEVVLDARQSGRRVDRLKRTGADAPSAARVVTHARAPLGDDRRYGTPQEEVEELWGEVARLAREHHAENGSTSPEAAPADATAAPEAARTTGPADRRPAEEADPSSDSPGPKA